MLIALIQDNTVKAITTTSTDEEYYSATHGYQLGIDITDANPQPQVGWILNGSTLAPAEGSATPVRKITKLGLRQRFTFSELIAIQNISKTVVAVEVLLNNLAVATYVDLNRPDTMGGMMLLASAGAISTARANEILSAPIQDYEKYKGNE